VADKRRDSPGKIAEVTIIGDVTGKEAVILDDIIDTAGTMAEVSRVLIQKGAKNVWACATHGVLSGAALKKINDSPLERVVLTDTIPLEDKLQECPKLKVLSVSALLGDAIMRIHQADSVSSLFI